MKQVLNRVFITLLVLSFSSTFYFGSVLYEYIAEVQHYRAKWNESFSQLIEVYEAQPNLSPTEKHDLQCWKKGIANSGYQYEGECTSAIKDYIGAESGWYYNFWKLQYSIDPFMSNVPFMLLPLWIYLAKLWVVWIAKGQKPRLLTAILKHKS